MKDERHQCLRIFILLIRFELCESVFPFNKNKFPFNRCRKVLGPQVTFQFEKYYTLVSLEFITLHVSHLRLIFNQTLIQKMASASEN